MTSVEGLEDFEHVSVDGDLLLSSVGVWRRSVEIALQSSPGGLLGVGEPKMGVETP